MDSTLKGYILTLFSASNIEQMIIAYATQLSILIGAKHEKCLAGDGTRDSCGCVLDHDMSATAPRV